MSEFVVLECRKTFAFMVWGYTPFGVWVPTVEVRRPPPRGHSGPGNLVRVAAMPGYAFVPVDSLAGVLATAPPMYNPTILAYGEDERPKTVDVQELRAMAEASAGVSQQATKPLPAGTRVEIVLGPFAGFEGVALPGGTVRNIRLSVGVRVINMPVLYVKAIK